MPRDKRSDEAKVMDYFNSATEDRARLLLGLAKASIDRRFPKVKPIKIDSSVIDPKILEEGIPF